jgi:hypothetical protein
VDDSLQNFVDAGALLGASQHGIARVETDDGFDLLADPLGLCGRQIDFVDDRDDFEVVVQGQVGVGEGLRLHALRGINDQQRAFAGLQAARDLIGEIDVTGCIDQVQLILLAVLARIVKPHGMRLDGDAALAFEVHRIEHLLHHFALGEGAGELKQPVSESRLTVVDMRNDREIADELGVHALWGTL